MKKTFLRYLWEEKKEGLVVSILLFIAFIITVFLFNILNWELAMSWYSNFIFLYIFVIAIGLAGILILYAFCWFMIRIIKFYEDYKKWTVKKK